MSRQNRQKRLWRDVLKQPVKDAEGHTGILYRAPDDWLDKEAEIPDEVADAVVADLRAWGVKLWLHPDPVSGTIRTRIMFPPGTHKPSKGLIEDLSRYARVLGKAVERSGDWQPPQPNPFNDEPLPAGGRWTWYD
jgi:hypothetical protein